MRGIVSQEEVRGGGRKGVRKETCWGGCQKLVGEGQGQVEDIIRGLDTEPLQGNPRAESLWGLTAPRDQRATRVQAPCAGGSGI